MSVEYKLSVSDSQALKMRRGHSVRIPASGIGVGMPVMVSADQAKKLDRAKRSGKGSTIRLSPEQINSMLMKGGSIFDNIKSVARKFKGVVTPIAGVAKEVLSPIAEELFKEAKGRLTKKAREKVTEVGKSLLDKGLKRIGAGMKPRGRPRKVKGGFSFSDLPLGRPRKVKGGFSFSDFVSGATKAVNVIKPIYDIAKPLIDPLAKAGFDVAKERLIRGRAKGGAVRKRNYVSSGSDEPVQYDGLAIRGGFSIPSMPNLNISKGDILKGYVNEGVRMVRKVRDVTKPIYQIAKSTGLLPDDPRLKIATKLIYGDGLAPPGMRLGKGLAPPGMSLGRGMKKSKKTKKIPGAGLFAPGMRGRR